MNLQKLKKNSICVGGRLRSATINVYGDKISEGSKVINGFCSVCNRKNSMTVSDDKLHAEGLGDFFKNSGKKWLKISRRMAKTCSMTQDEPWTLQQSLPLQLLLKTLNRLYQHYQGW